ncbi:TatD family hydrolase [Oceanobacillus chungangensis]|uniref:TatD family deoxyribonuclease n=1 Tax=Oceanobacillus chungangensis TaxID=1229152 RepID=A0A3D8PT96_9BACI|nr:TatD family hydrolase [Oceanobacillus chungangensis]RDW19370.1 TatD family deoxyribonuclease [Oceanobacillus chungangensis]
MKNSLGGARSLIDAHIHLDKYARSEQRRIMSEMECAGIESLITVSYDLVSAKENLKLHREHNNIKAAFGFHPEQQVLNDEAMQELIAFIELHNQEMIAIGEVGLPYYTRKENPFLNIEPYMEILEQFIILAKRYKKPIVLHAIYEDAGVVCNLLEKHAIKYAHFHWFKGDILTIERMIRNGYFISITPDVLYEQEIQHLVNQYPLSQMMVETDGPWTFTGPFEGKMTHPQMIHQSIEAIASIKALEIADVYRQLLRNTKQFYQI